MEAEKFKIGDIVYINNEKAKILNMVIGESKYEKCVIIMLEGDNLGQEFSINSIDLKWRLINGNSG